MGWRAGQRPFADEINGSSTEVAQRDRRRPGRGRDSSGGGGRSQGANVLTDLGEPLLHSVLKPVDSPILLVQVPLKRLREELRHRPDGTHEHGEDRHHGQNRIPVHRGTLLSVSRPSEGSPSGSHTKIGHGINALSPGRVGRVNRLGRPGEPRAKRKGPANFAGPFRTAGWLASPRRRDPFTPVVATRSIPRFRGRAEHGTGTGRRGSSRRSSRWRRGNSAGVVATRQLTSRARIGEGVSNAYLPNRERVTSSTTQSETAVHLRLPSPTWDPHHEESESVDHRTRSADASHPRWPERRVLTGVAPHP